jgi:hypothetical protein
MARAGKHSAVIYSEVSFLVYYLLATGLRVMTFHLSRFIIIIIIITIFIVFIILQDWYWFIGG